MPANPNEETPLYRNIYVPVDNSAHSNRAISNALRLGKAYESKLVGCHVYAARMHDYRFKQMEYTLPEEYLDETELDRQRKIHDSLITMGLKLISDSYLDQMDRDCQELGIDFERKMMDGKHHTELVRDMHESDYDLTLIGALGMGRVKDSHIGSVCERVARMSRRDVWVVKHVPRKDEPERDTIVVGIDGSPQSFGALMTALDLAVRFEKKVEIVGVYDPYLHYSVFHGIVGVLSEKASKVFRFEEQNQLHEEIIDTGLAQIYQSHLNVAQTMARRVGIELETTLLPGKAFQKVLNHVRQVEPWLLVLGRIGVHSPADEAGLGSNAENLLRLAPCDVLLSTRLEYPELDLKAEQSIRWTPEAEERMTRVPPQVKGIARTAILRLAIEGGHSVVSSDLVTEAMERFMPKRAAQATERLAEALALDKARQEPLAMCKKCGVTASDARPVKCSVCGGEQFETITQEVVDRIASMEGGVEEETTYDGRKLKWTQEARRALFSIEDKYQMRRAKAMIEKTARIRHLDTISLEFAREIMTEETGMVFLTRTPALEPATEAESTLDDRNVHDDRQVVGVDSKGVPMISTHTWTEEAVQRTLRVPSGFMRDRTQRRIEELAEERGVETIDLTLVEDGIEMGKRMMAEMLQQYAGGNGPDTPADNGTTAREAAQCPAHQEQAAQPNSNGNGASRSTPLNEAAGIMPALERGRSNPDD